MSSEGQPVLAVVVPVLSRQLFDELKVSIRGDAILRGDPQFPSHSRLFNGNVVCESQAVVLPLDAQDVSRIIIFSRKHALSISVKAGGYGTHGCAVNGQVIIDLSRLTDVDIEPPLPETDGLGYTSLSEMVPSHAKGKGKAGVPSTTSTLVKRTREELDAPSHTTPSYPSYIASVAVDSFLNGSPLPPDNSGEAPREPPTSRRKVDGSGAAVPGGPASVERQTSGSSENSNSHSTGTPSRTMSSATSVGSRSPGNESPDLPKSLARAVPLPEPPAPEHDPFGYLAEDGPRPTRLLPTPAQSATSPALSSNAAYFPSDPRAFAPAASSSSAPAPTPSVRLDIDGDVWGSDAADILSHPLFNPGGSHFDHRAAAGDVAPVYRCAYVTFGAGANQKAVDRFTATNPLEAVSVTGERSAVPYHVPFSAHPVGSSVMLLGGFGFLSRLHGLSIDNLVEVEVVLADGTIVIANERDHPDLWWAMRGAGPAFGIATRYKARAYPVPVVFAGNLIYRFHRATAPSLIKHFRDCVKGAPRELYANLILTAGPADKDSLVVIQMCFVGARTRGQEFLSTISSWDGEPCLLKEVDEKRFLNQQDSVAQVLRGRAGNQWFIRSALASALPDEVINKTVLEFANTPIGCTWLFELAGGAISDVEQSCVPKTQREAAFTIAALHQWEMNVDDPRCVEAAESWLSETIGRVALGGPFPSFLGRHEDPKRVMASFGENWARLAELKKQYDADGVFRNSFWPLDVNGDVLDPRVHEPRTPNIDV